MKTTNKKIAALLAGVMVISAMSGCGKKNEGLTEDGKVLLEITTQQKEVNEKAYTQSMEKYADFEKYYSEVHPDSNGVHIEPNYYVYSPKDYAAVALGGELPTYYSVHLTESKGIMDAGYAKDITKWMEKYNYIQGLDEKMKKAITRDGKIYLMPIDVYSVGIAVNLDMLEKAGYVDADGTPHQPKTFEELAEMAKTIKDKTGNSGFMMPTMSNAGGWRFTPVAWAYGVTFMEQDKDGKWQATFNTPECVAALQWVKDLKWKYDVIPENVLIDEGKVRNAFGAGEAAMAFAEGAQASTFVNAGMNRDNIGFIQMPAGPKRHVTLIGGSYNVFNKDATDAQIDAAFEYLDWNGSGRILNDEIKERIRTSLQTKADEGKLIGVLTASPYNDEDPRRAYEIQLNTVEMANINMNHVKLYNDQSNIEWQQEEPVEAQALYAVLDNAIQAVLTDENADCKALIEEACQNFQATLDVVNNS